MSSHYKKIVNESDTAAVTLSCLLTTLYRGFRIVGVLWIIFSFCTSFMRGFTIQLLGSNATITVLNNRYLPHSSNYIPCTMISSLQPPRGHESSVLWSPPLLPRHHFSDWVHFLWPSVHSGCHQLCLPMSAHHLLHQKHLHKCLKQGQTSDGNHKGKTHLKPVFLQQEATLLALYTFYLF